NQLLLDLRWRNNKPFVPYDAVHLGTHAEVAGEVDARFDRKSAAANKTPLFARLEVVDVWAAPVQRVRIDGMSRAMPDRAFIAMLDENGACRVVGVRAANIAPSRQFARDMGGSSIACIAHRIPCGGYVVRRVAITDPGHPRLIGPDSAFLVCPQIDEQHVVAR